MNRIRRILMIEIGTFLLALAIGMFILPGKILTGGVAGITSILSKYVHALLYDNTVIDTYSMTPAANNINCIIIFSVPKAFTVSSPGT